MSEEPPIDFKDGDIVWVNLSLCWWPGEVKDIQNAPNDLLNTKKSPLFFVKFFDEDSYEDIKNTSNVYKYNCEKKTDFIKKGLSVLKSDTQRINKFRLDINLAETKTGGNADILDDPIFSPQKKSNIVNEIFGTPVSAKKTPKSGGSRSKGRLIKSPKKGTTKANITHKRFLGFDDFEIRIRLQNPKEDVNNYCNSSDFESDLNDDKRKQKLLCYQCNFETSCIDILMSHTKNHLTNKNTDAKTQSGDQKSSKKSSSPKKTKKMINSPKKSLTSVKNKYDSDDNDDVVKPKLKRKRKSQPSSIKTKQKKIENEPKTSVSTDLLAEWADDDDDLDDNDFLPIKPIIDNAQQNNSTTVIDDKKNETQNIETIIENTDKLKDSNSKSCFDFDEEEEEEDTSIVNTTTGRKIPRVIPPPPPPTTTTTTTITETRRSTSEDENSENLSVIENKTEEILKDNNELINTSSTEKNSSDDLAFKNFMDSTTVPELPDLPTNSNKSLLEKNVQEIIPIPTNQLSPQINNNKSIENVESREIATKLTNPKKRFVKTFEDFEQLQNEQKRIALEEKSITDIIKTTTSTTASIENVLPNVQIKDDEKIENNTTTENMAVEISKLKCKIMSKLSDEEVESSKFSKIRGQKFFKNKIDTINDKLKNIVNTDNSKKDKLIENVEEKQKISVTDKGKLSPSKKSKYFKHKKSFTTTTTTLQDKYETEEDIIDEITIKEKDEIKQIDVEKSTRRSKKRLRSRSSFGSDPDESEATQSKLLNIKTTNDSKLENITQEIKSKNISKSTNKLEESLMKTKTKNDQVQKMAHDILAEWGDEDFDSSQDSKISKTSEEKITENLEIESKVEEIPSKDIQNVEGKLEENIIDNNKVDLETKTQEEKVKSQENKSDEILFDEKINKNEEETIECKDLELKNETINEVSFKSANIDETNQTNIDISIKTNLTNFSKDENEMLALKTLATISELKTNLDDLKKDEIKILNEEIEGTTTTITKSVEFPFEQEIDLVAAIPTVSEQELISIDGNLTVVSEKDLADGQEVEITATNDPNKKPVTLTNFSMDFSDCNSNNSWLDICEQSTNNNNNNNNSRKEKDAIKQIKKSKMNEIDEICTSSLLNKNKTISLTDDLCDVEEHIPSQIVCAQEAIKVVENEFKLNDNLDTVDSSPKLLERLTDSKLKITSIQTKLPTQKRHEIKVPTTTTTGINKNNKLITESKMVKIVKSVVTTSPLITKPKIVSSTIKSDKLIKNQKLLTIEKTEKSKILNKKNVEDVEDGGIEAFIIPKPDLSDDDSSSSDNTFKCNKTTRIVGTTTSKTPTATTTTHFDDPFIIKKSRKIYNETLDNKHILPKITKKPITINKKIGGKAKILQQTIITPAGEIIQPTLTQTDDFDINSMPIVLSDQILTPESIENMPIIMSSDCVQTTTPTQQQTVTVRKNPSTIIKKPSYSQVRLINNKTTIPISNQTLIKTTPKFIQKTTKILPNTKLIKHNNSSSTTFSTNSKYVIVSQSSNPTTTSKYTVGKRQTLIKRSLPATATAAAATPATEPVGNKIMIVTNQHGQQQRLLLTPAQQKLIGYQNTNKLTKTVMKGNLIQKGGSNILTTTTTSSSTTTTTKEINPALASSSGLINQKQIISTLPSQQRNKTITNTQQTHGIKFDKLTGRRIQVQNPRTKEFVNIKSTPQKTVLIKNQQGQTLSKIQVTDEALLDQQVAEQLEAIKASTMQQKNEAAAAAMSYSSKTLTKTIPVRRSYSKKTYETIKTPIKEQQIITTTSSSSSSTKGEVSSIVPPLAPISPIKKTSEALVTAATTITPAASLVHETKLETTTKTTSVANTSTTSAVNEVKQQTERPLNQLIIQDAMGNQTTITEGQILALPNDTVDGQPNSYMLVTLDESGNLTPLNNDALMALDPNLGLGGELNNTILQIDNTGIAQQQQQQDENVVTSKVEGTSNVASSSTSIVDKLQIEQTNKLMIESENQNVDVNCNNESIQQQQHIDAATSLQSINLSVQGTAAAAAGGGGGSSVGDSGQQLIVTGDPVATQKFLESLTEGNTDLANILASAEGSSILIQADGQILINTDSDNNQMLLAVNTTDNLNTNLENNNENEVNPIFATQSTKNQDILAAALADTDVFQQEQQQQQLINQQTINKTIQSQLSPNSVGVGGGNSSNSSSSTNTLYPMNVGNVLETSLTLNSPIMTPLEVPSTNSKKIADENDILTQQVPKNVDLPITITDPNISQTVSQQQVATLMAHELQNNLEISIPITDSVISSVTSSTEMNSPSSFVYSLPSLDESNDINQKPFNSSMPLLTEDNEELSSNEIKKDKIEETTNTTSEQQTSELTAENLLTDYIKDDLIKSDDITTTTTTSSSNVVVSESNQNDNITKNEEIAQVQTEAAVTVQQQPVKTDSVITTTTATTTSSSGDFLDKNEGLYSLGGEICSSLSEPPPDMFDISEVFRTQAVKSDTSSSDLDSKQSIDNNKIEDVEEDEKMVDDNNTKIELAAVDEHLSSSESINPDTTSVTETESSPPNSLNEDSCEIPVQPEIVTDLSDKTFDSSNLDKDKDFDNKNV